MSVPVILLVEDNSSDEKLTLLALKTCGVDNQVAVARDGAAALKHLFGDGDERTADPPELPKLVLLDLKLPKVDGLDVLRRIRSDARTKLVPVIVLTSSLQDEDVIQSYSLGANAYIRKPVDFSVFTEAARTLAQFWLILNETAPTPSAAS